MIKTVKISNFKSVQDLEIELGRLNVFIGENGCGKTSILEGIAMGSAAAQEKLDNEFLVSRGVRVTSPPLMRSAFKKIPLEEEIVIQFKTTDPALISFTFIADKDNSQKWNAKFSVGEESGIKRLLKLNDEKVAKEFANELIEKAVSLNAIDLKKETTDKALLEQVIKQQIDEMFYEMLLTGNGPERFSNLFTEINLSSFLLYAPENYFLRRFEEEGQIRPLGIRGEGLFSHLVQLSKEGPETFAAIADNLSLIDWYGGFSIPNDLQFTERRIAITDRFISNTIKNFDQRSANEGFLYLLFYFTLFLSKWTPKFFAIDNVDNALNPRLCAKLIEILARLAKEQDKQAILTTHNPAILDGLDLHDDEQRLFVIYRNTEGATQARRVKPLQQIPGVEPVRLSEAFVRGYLGGLPKNF